MRMTMMSTGGFRVLALPILMAAAAVFEWLPSVDGFSSPSLLLSTRSNFHGKARQQKTACSAAAALQLLEFQEPRTNVTVVLVGAMHYNPASIQLAEQTIQDLGKQDRLASVIVESCDIRWNKTAALYEEKPLLKKLLNNEMRTACDVALSFNRPVVLGDQRINITGDALKSSLKQTFVDLGTPPLGWKRFADQVQEAWTDTVPFGGKGYLTAFAFFDPRLFLVLPVSLVKYPLSYLVRNPITTTIVLSLFAALSFAEDPMQSAVSNDEIVPFYDWIISFGIAALETAVFARLLLKPLLADRNEILAKSILDQCELYGSTAGARQPTVSPGGSLDRLFSFSGKSADDSEAMDPKVQQEVVYAPGSPPIQITKRGNSNNKQVVVAVLGMAHCNGIMKLLKEKRV